MHTWTREELIIAGVPQALGRAFTPVARLTGMAKSFYISASGFLIHPRILLTAAHAVSFMSDTQLEHVRSVQADLGSVRVWADAMVVTSSYFQTQDSTADVAVLRLPFAVCAPSNVLRLSSKPDTQEPIPATVWGWQEGALRAREVEAMPTPDMLTYVAPDLPGLSGGPLIAQRDAARMGETLGVHVGFHSDTGLGEAVAVSFEDARGAMESLGFDF